MTVSGGLWRGTAWNYLGAVFRFAIQFGFGLLLARLLGPEPFGQFAIAAMVVAFAQQVGDLGFTPLIITRSNSDPSLHGTALLRQVLAAVLLAVVLFCGAGPLAAVLSQPEAAPVLRAMAAVLLLASCTRVPLAALRQRMDFARLQQVQVLALFLGYAACALPLALSGAGVWALVGAQAGIALTTCLALWLYAPPPLARPRLRLDPADASLARANLGTAALSSLVAHLETMVLSRQLGGEQLGLWNRLQVLTINLTHVASEPLQTSLLPWYARLREAPGRIAEVQTSLLACASLLIMPWVVTAIMVPERAVGLLLGPHWVVASPVLPWLAIAAWLYLMLLLQVPVLTALLGSRTEFVIHAVCGAIGVPLIVLACRSGLQAVAQASCALIGLRACLYAWAAMRRGALQGIAAFVVLRQVALPCLVTAATAWLVRGWTDHPAWLVLPPMLGLLAGLVGVRSLPWMRLPNGLAEALPPPLRRLITGTCGEPPA